MYLVGRMALGLHDDMLFAILSPILRRPPHQSPRIVECVTVVNPKLHGAQTKTAVGLATTMLGHVRPEIRVICPGTIGQPKCSYASRVATRPRGVRCKKPFWMRNGS